jgi:hypothetical protein
MKENFEIYLKGPDSPSKKSKRFSSSKERPDSKYDPDSLIP